MSTQATIESKLIEAFSPERLRIDNDSKRHAGPATDSHFRVVLVAQAADEPQCVRFLPREPVAEQRQLHRTMQPHEAG